MRRVQLLSSSWKPKVLSMEFFGFSTRSQGHFGAVKGLQRPSGLQIWSQALSIEDNLSCHWENPAGISGIRITFWLGGIPAWQMGWHHPPAVPTPFLVHAWYTDRDDFRMGYVDGSGAGCPDTPRLRWMESWLWSYKWTSLDAYNLIKKIWSKVKPIWTCGRDIPAVTALETLTIHTTGFKLQEYVRQIGSPPKGSSPKQMLCL